MLVFFQAATGFQMKGTLSYSSYPICLVSIIVYSTYNIAVTNISSCWIYAMSRGEIKQLAHCKFFRFCSPFVCYESPQALALSDGPAIT